MVSIRGWLTRLLILTGLLFVAVPFAQKGVSILAQSHLRAAFEVQDEVVPAAGDHPGDQKLSGRAEVPPGPETVLAVDDSALTPGRVTDGQAAKRTPGRGIARIIITELGVDAMVVDGTSPWDLARGPGFYPEGSLPDLGGNVVIAGHRTTYGAWFRHIDRLEPGDTIKLFFGGKVYHYEVERVWTIAYNDWSVIAQTDDHVLTLTTCHPPGSSRERLVVRARWARTSHLSADVSQTPFS